MKRKTNLFYLSGDDSNFITFSNYGESMTGNFLATDWKMYPSRFICMYLKFLDTPNPDEYEKQKSAFIKYIAAYYENKLAFLRDHCLEQDIETEETLMPLNYLLEAIYNLTNSTIDVNGCFFNTHNNNTVSVTDNNDNIYISFVGDVTEQDYNGIYADTICCINSNDYKRGNIIIETSDNDNGAVDYKHNTNVLYGWENNTVPSEYNNVVPIFDLNNSINFQYYTNSKITAIDLTENTAENIKFNIVIPLYDLINISTHNNDILDEEIQTRITLSHDDNTYIKNVPLGIWMTDSVVELKRDNKTGYSPSWSLLLSSQFKPFPYSQKMPNEITQDSTKEAFATYSQILIRQNRILDLMENLEGRINDLETQISTLNTRIGSLGTSYYMDNLQKELINFEHYENNQIEILREEMYSYIAKWKGYIS